MWKFRIEKHMGVRAGRCMRTMSRPRHVRRREHDTSGPNMSHAQASPLARHSLDAHTPRDARSWWPHQQHGIFVLGQHSYKQSNRVACMQRAIKQASKHAASSCQTTNPPTKTETDSDAPNCRIIPQDKSTRRCLERWCCGDRVRWRCLLAFWMMLFRDGNCSAIRHSEKVSIHE
jgi:hypothetical protein